MVEPGGVEPPIQPCEGCVLPLNHGPTPPVDPAFPAYIWLDQNCRLTKYRLNHATGFLPFLFIHFGTDYFYYFARSNRPYFTTNI